MAETTKEGSNVMVVKRRVVTAYNTPQDGVTEEKRKYRRLLLRRSLFLIFCVILLLTVAGVSLALGSAEMSFFDAYAAIFGRFFPNIFHVTPLADTVVWTLRLPRMLLAVLAGAAFAMAGSTTQAILRNPLATPYTLGVSAGAALGAAIGIIVGRGVTDGPLLIVGNSFVFSIIPIFVILLMIKRRGASPETIILSGIAIMYIFSACTTLLQYFAESNAVSATVFWAIGDLSRAAWWQLPYILSVFILCFIINLRLAWDLNIMKMGDDSAKSLGVEVDRVRIIVLLTACLSTAVVVSFTGAIGFICLVAPHICRAVVGGDERLLLVSSSLFGAILLIFADIIARRLIAPIVLPVGAITAFLGGPLLLYLLIRRRRVNQ
ncbi:MAG: iron ABC transporter permease [Candidatus Bathyarchaeota archaeon]|nr:iron ABC transporter permease [Candidatus Bathyarchaeota archaeon]